MSTPALPRPPARRRALRRLAALVALLLAAAPLAGCGKRGPPEPPSGRDAPAYPRTYPSR